MKPLIDYINEGRLPRINLENLNDIQLLQFYWDVWSGWDNPRHNGLNASNTKAWRASQYMYKRYGDGKAYELTSKIILDLCERAGEILGVKWYAADDTMRQLVHKLIEINIDLIMEAAGKPRSFDVSKLKTK